MYYDEDGDDSGLVYDVTFSSCSDARVNRLKA